MAIIAGAGADSDGPKVLRLMNNKEVKLPVLAFGTEQIQLLKFDSQVILVSSSSRCSGSKTLRVPIARLYCMHTSWKSECPG